MRVEAIEILLVDDSPSDVDLTIHALRNSALIERIHVARDGEEALNFLFCRDPFLERSGQPLPRLILLDLKLPKLDGLSVLRTLMQDSRTRSTPVIILTSSREDRDLTASYDLGVNSYIQKPVDFDQFRETLRTLGAYWLLVNQAPPLRTPASGTETPG
jgi:two-component system, response regulator